MPLKALGSFDSAESNFLVTKSFPAVSTLELVEQIMGKKIPVFESKVRPALIGITSAYVVSTFRLRKKRTSM
ncbi:MAG TPA: hypothetical protein VIA08_00880 [Nitrososphaeraceae archaeon]